MVARHWNIPALHLGMRPKVSGQIHPSKLRVVRVKDDAEYRDSGASPDVCMIVHGYNIISAGIAIRVARLDLNSNAKACDSGFVCEVNVGILAEIMLLADLLKRASLVLKKESRDVHAVSTGDTNRASLHRNSFSLISLLSLYTQPVGWVGIIAPAMQEQRPGWEDGRTKKGSLPDGRLP